MSVKVKLLKEFEQDLIPSIKEVLIFQNSDIFPCVGEYFPLQAISHIKEIWKPSLIIFVKCHRPSSLDLMASARCSFLWYFSRNLNGRTKNTSPDTHSSSKTVFQSLTSDTLHILELAVFKARTNVDHSNKVQFRWFKIHYILICI